MEKPQQWSIFITETIDQSRIFFENYNTLKKPIFKNDSFNNTLNKFECF